MERNPCKEHRKGNKLNKKINTKHVNEIHQIPTDLGEITLGRFEALDGELRAVRLVCRHDPVPQRVDTKLVRQLRILPPCSIYIYI